MKIERIRKRDGRLVPFDETKIRDAVQRAMLAVGEGDLGFAGEVAGVVRLALESRRAGLEGPEVSGAPGASGAPGRDTTPGIEEIQDLVENALIQLGRASVAKAYILYRDRRAKVREVLEVHRSPAPGVRVPRVLSARESAPSAWSKGRIVAALMSEAELARPTAEDVASRVEARVFSLGQSRISTALVRELVDGELAGLGLDGALHRQASVLLPAQDLRRELVTPARPLSASRAASAEELAGLDASRRIAGEALRRWSLDHVLDEASLERQLSGDLMSLDLTAPHLYLWGALPAELFSDGDAAEGSAFELLGELARAAQSVSQGVVLENAERALQGLARGKSSRRGGALGEWLRAASAVAQAAGRRIDLGLDSERALEFLERLLEAFGAIEDASSTPRVFADERLLCALADAAAGDATRLALLDRALERGLVVPTWSSETERFAAPGCQRGTRERAAVYCAGAVALNLPRLALRAGPWREDRLLEELFASIEAALVALGRLHEFQQSTRGARPYELRGRISFALAPVGLREALQVLGDGELRPEQGARILGFLADASRRLSLARSMTLVPTAFFGAQAAERFAEADRALPPLHQRLLFSEAGRVEPGRAYGAGLRLSPAPGFVPWAAEAELFSTWPVGALAALPEDRSRGGLLSLAESAARFFRLRRDGTARHPEGPRLTPGGWSESAPRAAHGLFDGNPIPGGSGGQELPAPRALHPEPRH